MIFPMRAVYGERDSAHALLEWSGHSGIVPPPDLLGLTDRPPGSYGPGERWWPSAGCGPVGQFWALWWTEPDEGARRGGMVRSEAALWRLSEIGAVDDLQPTMELLAGRPLGRAPSQELVRAVAEALLSQDPAQPVVKDLAVWPGLLIALWKRLWTGAKQGFSARTAISPPQAGDSVLRPWLFGTTVERALQWSAYRLISEIAVETTSSRAVNWWVGSGDVILDEVLNACPPLTADLADLRRAARAADGLALLRKSHTPLAAVSLLRTLLTVAPAPDSAVALKEEALLVLRTGLSNSPLELVLSLSNLRGDSLPSEKSIAQAVGQWVIEEVPELNVSEAAQLFERLLPAKGEGWWQDSVLTALLANCRNPDLRWAKAGLQWLTISRLDDVVTVILPGTREIERSLLVMARVVQTSREGLKQLLMAATSRNWSKLHAQTLLHLFDAGEALRQQLAFHGEEGSGVAYIVEHAAGPIVVEAALALDEPRLTQIVAGRTAREPALLEPLDARQQAWCRLWVAHISAGGSNWPPGLDKAVLGRQVLDTILAGEEQTGIAKYIAGGLVEAALDHPERSRLWQTLEPNTRNTMLPKVAAALTTRIDAGVTVPEPELALLTALRDVTRKGVPSPHSIAALLSWESSVNEDEAIAWLSATRSALWGPAARSVGESVFKKRWRRAAFEIYRLSKRSTPELQVAAEICQDLLPAWDRLILTWGRAKVSSHMNMERTVIERAADLGASLAPDRLEYIWVRAGGQRKYLPVDGTPETRWQEAARLAQDGALLGGLLALIEVLLEAMPFNEELLELKFILTRN